MFRPSLVLSAALLVSAVPTHADASEVRKCVGRDGRHAYVSGECPAGSREAWRREVVEAAPDGAAEARREEIRHWQRANREEVAAGVRARSMRTPLARPAAAPVDARARRCERARERQRTIRQREWMSMTYERMRQLDEDVRVACR